MLGPTPATGAVAAPPDAWGAFFCGASFRGACCGGSFFSGAFFSGACFC
ncbi:pentapeptide repeat-containing protein [Streptomyces sp. PU-14G]